MSKDNIPKKQHYVPQYYLRRFADSEERLYVFDQFRQKEYQSPVADVCERNHHYEMKAAQPRDWHGPFLLHGKIELQLREIENKQAKLLDEIERQALSGRIHEKERRGLTRLIAHFLARHPTMKDDSPPDYETLFSDPEVRAGCETLVAMGMEDEIEVLANGANQMVLALWQRKGTPTYFAMKDLEKFRCTFIRPEGDARFITSSLPPHFNTSLRSDGKYHFDDLMFPISSTLGVLFDDDGLGKNMVRSIPDDYVVRFNAGYFVSEPICEQIVAGRKQDLDQAKHFIMRERIAGRLK